MAATVRNPSCGVCCLEQAAPGVADPRVEQMARGGGSVDAVYEAAAGERARNERRRLTTQLRQRGVEVVDAPPETFAPAVSDAYLSLKAAGRL